MQTIKKYFISYSLLLISLLPLPILYLLSDFLFILILYVIKYRNKVVDLNLKNAFPEKTDKERHQIKVDFYRFFADLLVECIKMRSISSKQVMKRWTFTNLEVLQHYYEQKQSIIFVTGHYGNWEWGIFALSLLGLHTPKVVYKPIHDTVFESIFNQMRSRFGAEMIPTKRILRKIVSLKGQTHSSVFLADQTPAYKESDLFIPFLKQETLVYKGIERIAKITGYPVVFCHIDRTRRGYYSCDFRTIIDDPSGYEDNKITYIYNEYLENIIKEKPALWLWSHKRWKHRRQHD